ncbi:MAG: aldehyde dehydrogenase family protein, partial [Bacteroidetes bacterium]|nr:aldehyde dehydrogenase family protein [Bacteroidota bacterium]
MMDNLEKDIRQLVQEVIHDMNLFPATKLVAPENAGVFSDINDAIHAGGLAFRELNKLTLETRRNIIANIRKMSLENIDILSRMAHEETGMGRWEDKVVKNNLGIVKTPGVEDIVSESFSDDDGLTLVERAPYGVIGSSTPSKNPTVTIISNSIGMIAAGPGNPPCVVDETADLAKAGRDIVNGASFDNNVICICEKEI